MNIAKCKQYRYFIYNPYIIYAVTLQFTVSLASYTIPNFIFIICQRFVVVQYLFVDVLYDDASGFTTPSFGPSFFLEFHTVSVD